jgi:hypothetical protein
VVEGVVAVLGPPYHEAACRARCRHRPARVRGIPGSASRPVHPIRPEQRSWWRAPAARDTEWLGISFIQPRPPGPASVHSRCAPRGTSPRRRGDGPRGQARSYAGTAQYPCAGRIGGRPRADDHVPFQYPACIARPHGAHRGPTGAEGGRSSDSLTSHPASQVLTSNCSRAAGVGPVTSHQRASAQSGHIPGERTVQRRRLKPTRRAEASAGSPPARNAQGRSTAPPIGLPGPQAQVRCRRTPTPLSVAGSIRVISINDTASDIKYSSFILCGSHPAGPSTYFGELCSVRCVGRQ